MLKEGWCRLASRFRLPESAFDRLWLAVLCLWVRFFLEFRLMLNPEPGAPSTLIGCRVSGIWEAFGSGGGHEPRPTI